MKRNLLPCLCALAIGCGQSHAETQVHFVHNDHLGTPQALTNSQQTVVWQAHHQPFGEAEIDEDVDKNGEKVALGLRFPGQYSDSGSGLYYNYYRDYDPALGRYLQSDPIGLAGGINTYGYAHQNPVSNIDPDGLLVMNLVSGAVGATLGGIQSYSKTGSIGEAIEGAIIGGASNLITGKAMFNAASAMMGNLASQVDDPCFDGFNLGQVAAAGVLGGYDFWSRVPVQPNLLSATSIVGHTVATQYLSGEFVSSF